MHLALIFAIFAECGVLLYGLIGIRRYGLICANLAVHEACLPIIVIMIPRVDDLPLINVMPSLVATQSEL